MRYNAEVFHTLKGLVKKAYGTSASNVGDEGGVAPAIESATEALELITEAIRIAGYTNKVCVGIDPASSEFYKEEANKYALDFKQHQPDPKNWLTYTELAKLYAGLTKDYPVISIEDPFAEDDWEAWTWYTKDATHQVVAYAFPP